MHEGEQLVAPHRIAQRYRARLVVADRAQHLAVRRVRDAIDQHESQRENDQHEVVEGLVIGQVEPAEHAAARYAGQAVIAACHRRGDACVVEHLCKRQRNHGKVEPLPLDG
ncbi:hypothetical protein D3C72_1764050 [compost metagenome]